MSDEEGGSTLDAEVLKILPDQPGVYRMLGSREKILYIGKAKSLKKRVTSYFQKKHDHLKTRLLVSKITDIKVTITQTEAEALILEQTLIKQYQPHYNILLKDDKSYPYIYVSDHSFPRLCFHRGNKTKPGHYFGPYVSGLALRETLSLLQKVFKVRQCEDSFFRNRSRPCLQYQIHRCTAPCVGKVSKAEYQQQVEQSRHFLEGRKGEQLVSRWVAKMEMASERCDYEEAAVLRDQIVQMKNIQARQLVVGRRGELDVLAVDVISETACVSVVHVRKGEVIGHENYVLSVPDESELGTILAAFIPQYYLVEERISSMPKEIIVSAPFDGMTELASTLAKVVAKNVRIIERVREARAAWVTLAKLNAEKHLEAHVATKESQHQRLVALQSDLRLDVLPESIECFDISHTQGEKAQASCVVFDRSGPVKSRYRRFNLDNIQPGDDYAGIAQAVFRRYKRQKSEESPLPNIVLIDGGKGQLNAAKQSLEECQIDEICLLAIAKGPERKPGLERIFKIQSDLEIECVELGSSSLLILQHIRDEAHRFAVAGHRARRDKGRRQSVLESIPGVGQKRRRQLLTHFGGLQGLKKASAQDLAQLPGISMQLAGDIVQALRVR